MQAEKPEKERMRRQFHGSPERGVSRKEKNHDKVVGHLASREN